MNKKSKVAFRTLGFMVMVVGGAVVSFGTTNTIKVIGGLMVAIGSAISSIN